MVLVTGSTGLVGAHLIYDLLKNGYPVKALVRKTSNKDSILHTFRFYSADADEMFKRIVWAEGDVTDFISLEEAFEDVDQVYHTAGFVSFNSYTKDQIFDINVNGTANVVNLCLEKKVQKLCHVSSVAALGVTDDGSPIDEEVFWKPVKNESAYSISKYKAEMEVWRGITEGLNAVIVNPSVILGPGNWKKSSAAIIEIGSKGLPFYTTGSSGFVDVRDVTKAMILLMNSDTSAERFVLSSENVDFKEVLKIIARSFHKKEPEIRMPKWILKIVVFLELVRAKLFASIPRMSVESISVLFRRFSYSSEKIQKKLHIEFRPVHQTLSDLCFMYQKSQ